MPPATTDHSPATKSLVDTTCPWCGAALSGAETMRGDAGSYTVARCDGCGTGVTWPVPSDAELDAAYGDWYRPDEGRFNGPGDRLLSWLRSRKAKHLDRVLPPGRVLDVGAGDGTLVGALRAHGRDAIGLERTGGGPYVRAGEVSDMEGEWSGVVFWHSLEHMRQPAATIKDAVALLPEGGLLVVAVPNFGSLQARVFGARWFALDLPRHLVHFDADGLRAGLEALGLRITRTSHVRGGQIFFGWVHGLVGWLPGQLDLYAAIRRSEARDEALSSRQSLGALVAAVLLSPFAFVASVVEVVLRKGGSVYFEARK